MARERFYAMLIFYRFTVPTVVKENMAIIFGSHINKRPDASHLFAIPGERYDARHPPTGLQKLPEFQIVDGYLRRVLYEASVAIFPASDGLILQILVFPKYIGFRGKNTHNRDTLFPTPKTLHEDCVQRIFWG